MDAPKKFALRWETGAAVTNGPLMTHPDYTQFIRADLCADPALLAEAVDRLTELTSALEAFWQADEAADYAEQFGMTQDPAEPLYAHEIDAMRAKANELWQAIPSHATAARAFIAKWENRHDDN